MVLVISPRLAGPLAIAISGLRKWYFAPDPEVREELKRMQVMLQKAANGGHRQPPFDPEELLAQAGRMKPLAVTYDVAGEMLSVSARTIGRLVDDHELATVGAGRGSRVVVASLEQYVSGQATQEMAS